MRRRASSCTAAADVLDVVLADTVLYAAFQDLTADHQVHLAAARALLELELVVPRGYDFELERRLVQVHDLPGHVPGLLDLQAGVLRDVVRHVADEQRALDVTEDVLEDVLDDVADGGSSQVERGLLV